MRRRLLAGAALLVSPVFLLSHANATVILDFTSLTGTGAVFIATALGPPPPTPPGTKTTLTSFSVPVEITSIASPIRPVPFDATFTLSATSTGPATINPSSGVIDQSYAGAFSVTSSTGLINYLSGTFSGLLTGLGSDVTLAGRQSVSFTSNVMFPPPLNQAVTISTNNFIPSAAIDNMTLASGSADLTGTFSAGVPEPSTWAMMLIGFAGLGFAGWHAARRSAA